MSSLTQEQTLLSSDDGSITLTTHRILQRSPEINKEIMLADFISYEQINRRSPYYKVLTILLLAASIILGIIYFNKVQESETLFGRFKMAYQSSLGSEFSINEQLQLFGSLFTASAILFGISLVLLLYSNHKSLRLSGKYSTIEFPIRRMKDSSFNRFVSTVITESDKRKREFL